LGGGWAAADSARLAKSFPADSRLGKFSKSNLATTLETTVTPKKSQLRRMVSMVDLFVLTSLDQLLFIESIFYLFYNTSYHIVGFRATAKV
jgi:hypothetical protein